MALNTHEEALIRTFFPRDRREQFLHRAANPKTRPKVMRRLAMLTADDFRYASVVPRRDCLPEPVFQILRQQGAPLTCHVMGDTPFDGDDMPLMEALVEHLDKPWDTFISCVPGKLAYFHTHETYDDDLLLNSLSR